MKWYGVGGDGMERCDRDASGEDLTDRTEQERDEHRIARTQSALSGAETSEGGKKNVLGRYSGSNGRNLGNGNRMRMSQNDILDAMYPPESGRLYHAPN